MKKILGFTLSLVAVTCLWAGTAAAVALNLSAEQLLLTMPDTTPVQMWGLKETTDPRTTWEVPVFTVTLPDTLSITLTNNLPADGASDLAKPTSLMIPGLQTTMVPTWTDGTTGNRFVNPATPQPTELTKRVRSLTHEAANGGGTAVYSWNNLKAGTYLIQSATHQAVQVPMGLYAVLKVLPATAGQVYEATATMPAGKLTYTTDTTLVFSEVDPALNAAVVGETYGPNSLMTSNINFAPTYYLVNGQPYAAGALPINIGTSADSALLRFVNAGLKTRMPVLQGVYMTVVGEDGNVLPYSLEQYSLEMTAGKTKEAIITNPDVPVIAVHDARGALTSAGVSGGGMLTNLAVSFGQAQVLFPNGGEDLTKKQAVGIQWAPVTGADNYSVFVSYNGVSYPTVATSVAGTSFDWTPTKLSSTAKVRVAAYNGVTFLGVDESDAAFNVVPKQTVVVTDPNGGVAVTGGAYHTVTWTAPPMAQTFTVQHSRTGIANWKTLATGVTTNSYTWKVPNIDRATNKIRILAYDVVGSPQSSDSSDTDFAIQKGVAVALPNGGETLTASGTYTVQWAKSADTAYVDLRYSLDNGATWKRFAANQTGTSKLWNVPATPSTQALVKVSAYDTNGVWLGDDVSNAVFDIQ